MPKSTRSFRFAPEQHRFIDEWRCDANEKIREYLDRERVKEAVGICASCSRPVYIRNFITVDGSTPYGNALELPSRSSIDLCDACDDEYRDIVTDADSDPPTMDYPQNNHLLYRVERDAVADAQPESDWAPLVTDRDDLDITDRLRYAVQWAQDTDLEARYRTESISADDILRALHEAVPDADTLTL